ncbi:PREDICTED: uncharacterized protein LOC105144029 [Acromyrmex echinatior]|uniref:uncharacterized protein LOC105144029 n=1 Tax=Acromyrmex echinatior TaxID=103372 RepID=UPI000580FC9C|nr:PREDICTED: uncharacterized protein LOC105144029 [Acromyrmex echinatior]
MEHRKMHLLGRRYDLTTTGYKSLEIGINVGPLSYMEITLRDHRGHKLLLSLETWKGLYEQRWNIYKMLRNEYKDNCVGPLTVSVCMLNDATLAHLEANDVFDVADGSREQPTDATLADWKKKDALARSLLSKSLDDAHFNLVVACKSSADMWKTLVGHYDEVSNTTKLAALEAYNDYHWKDDMTVNHAARAVEAPTPYNVKEVKRIFCYLKGTMSVGIQFGEGKNEVVGYCDSDYAGCPDTAKSTYGNVFVLNGGPISWESRKSTIVADSTTVAELQAAYEASKQAIKIS